MTHGLPICYTHAVPAALLLPPATSSSKRERPVVVGGIGKTQKQQYLHKTRAHGR